MQVFNLPSKNGSRKKVRRRDQEMKQKSGRNEGCRKWSDKHSASLKQLWLPLIVFPMANVSVVTFQPCVCRSKDELINMVIQLQCLQWQPHPLVRSCKNRGGMHPKMEEQITRQKKVENQRDPFLFWVSLCSSPGVTESVTGTSDYFWKMGNFVETCPTHSFPDSLALMHANTHKLPCVGTYLHWWVWTHTAMQICKHVVRGTLIWDLHSETGCLTDLNKPGISLPVRNLLSLILSSPE